MDTARQFEDFIVWQKAHQVDLAVYSETGDFPETEKFGTVSQMRRSAVPVASNIAKAFGKMSAKDKLRLLNISEGSNNELKYLLLLSGRSGVYE